MADVAKLIGSLASLAWPIILLASLFFVRKELKAALAALPTFFNRVRSAKLAGVELILDQLAEKSEAEPDKNGVVTVEQIRVAARLEVEAKASGPESFLQELDKLCIEYEAIRRVMKPGYDRTQQMTNVLVKMRGLAPSVSERIDVYKSSASAGSRLAAVAMMQMTPRLGDASWLLQRFSSDVPFIFYHAALALQSMANSASEGDLADIIRVATQAKQAVISFPDTPDQGSIRVLEAIIDPAKALT